MQSYAFNFNPLVLEIMLKRSSVKRLIDADRKQRQKLTAVLHKAKQVKRRLLEEKRQPAEEKKLLRDRTNKPSGTKRGCNDAAAAAFFK